VSVLDQWVSQRPFTGAGAGLVTVTVSSWPFLRRPKFELNLAAGNLGKWETQCVFQAVVVFSILESDPKAAG
jgi:hypothetical protein